ncbi:MAG: hypothetical protein NE327_09320 [Lentisphaeraceae bacterium]|nr:hypothetical protein [Lentisphaeraceae bacterium]
MKNNSQLEIDDFTQAVSSIKEDFETVIPKLISALIILILGILLAYIFKWLSKKIVTWVARLLPDSITEKPILKDNLPFIILGTGKILFFITIFFTISLSLNKMGMEILSEWLQNIGKFLPNMVGALIVIILGWKLKDFIGASIDKGLSKAGIQNSVVLSRLVSWSIFIISALVSLQQLGLNISLIITLSSVIIGVTTLGIALMFSLGAKDTVSDILYCYQLSKVLSVGSNITIKNMNGKIKAIGPVFVLLETENGNSSIPGKIFSQEILSFSDKGEANA